jgi:hypothetical protein
MLYNQIRLVRYDLRASLVLLLSDLGLNTDIPAGIRIGRLRVPPGRNFAGRVLIQCYSADFEIPAR